MARTSRRSKKGSLRVNLAEVEGRVKIPEGEHPLIVTEVTEEDGNAGSYLKWKFKVTGGDAEGGILYYNTSLAPQALWNLKSLLEALGYDIPDDEFDLPLDEFVDLECMGSIELETYDGKKQSRLVDFWPAEEDEKPKGKKKSKKDDDDEDEKPARGKRKEKDDDEDEKPARGKSRKSKDDDEDEKPSRSKGGSKKSKKKKTPQDEVDGMDEDELEDFIKEHDLDVDLDDFKTLRKKRAAVIDAGLEADVIEE